MPKYLIEREIPDAAALCAGELQAVTEDKITCVYIAPHVELVREHARLGGFPADRVLEVTAIIDPTTAEANQPAHAAESGA